MKSLLVKGLIFSILLFATDRLIVWILQSSRPIDYVGFIDAKAEIFEAEDKYEVLLMGDSHISDALDPKVLEDSLGLETFNAGIFLSSPYETYQTLKYLLEEKGQKPKVLVLGTNPVMFTLEADAGKYTPLVVQDPLFVLNLYRESDNPDYTTYFFKTAKEKYLAKALVNKILGKNKKPYREIENSYHGYISVYNQIEGTNWEGVPWQKAPVKESQVRYFAKMIELANKNDMKTFIVNPPIWWDQLAEIEENEGFKEFQHLVDSIGKAHNTPVHNLDHHFLQEELVFKDFLNHEHINHSGSLKYSPAIASWIKMQLP